MSSGARTLDTETESRPGRSLIVHPDKQLLRALKTNPNDYDLDITGGARADSKAGQDYLASRLGALYTAIRADPGLGQHLLETSRQKVLYSIVLNKDRYDLHHCTGDPCSHNEMDWEAVVRPVSVCCVAFGRV